MTDRELALRALASGQEHQYVMTICTELAAARLAARQEQHAEAVRLLRQRPEFRDAADWLERQR